jgi:hypothetical protein
VLILPIVKLEVNTQLKERMMAEAYEKAKPLLDAMFGYFQARQQGASVDTQEKMGVKAEEALDDYVEAMIYEKAEAKRDDSNW